VHTARLFAVRSFKGSAFLLLLGRHGPDVARLSARYPEEEMITMKRLILAAFAALTLTAGGAPMAYANTRGFYHNTYHSGPYDNTGNGPGQTGLDGGGG
jgi:hypothetical protein